ncbi:dihydropteroate synthase [Microvirga sp. VF16]|uniref:dihydropteroate synthase n=1 Tax=Microvirga sp. VF16 TaxID=2807101 RepID=UPI0035304A63
MTAILKDLGTRTLVMGVLNVTPDSFSDGGLFSDHAAAVRHAREMEQAGADMIDVGGESTRPGHTPVGAEEEQRRVIPIVRELAQILTVPISIDTYRASTARAALCASRGS